MTTAAPVETTLERLSLRAGEPRFRRSIRRGNQFVAAFAVWCHEGGDFDLAGLQTTQLVLALTGGSVRSFAAEPRANVTVRRPETSGSWCRAPRRTSRSPAGPQRFKSSSPTT